MGRLRHLTDRDGSNSPVGTDCSYSYDNLGRVFAESQTLVGLTPEIERFNFYDNQDRRALQIATIDGIESFLNAYAYDALEPGDKTEIALKPRFDQDAVFC